MDLRAERFAPIQPSRLRAFRVGLRGNPGVVSKDRRE